MASKPPRFEDDRAAGVFRDAGLARPGISWGPGVIRMRGGRLGRVGWLAKGWNRL